MQNDIFKRLSKPDNLVIQVVPSPSGGGAEVLAKELSGIVSGSFESKALYFSGTERDVLSESNYCIDCSPRNFFSIIKIRNILRRELRNYRTVLVHAHLTWPLFFCRLAALGLPVVLLYTEHNTYNKRRSIPLWRWFDRWFYKGYRKIVCISTAVLDSLSEWLGSDENLCVVNNGAHLNDYKPLSHRTAGLRLISVGRLVAAKGFDVAITAVAELRGEVESYQIWGEGPDRASLQSLIDKLGVGDFIQLMGWSDCVNDHLTSATLQLIPSRWEGFGLVAIEGMSTGLPILVSEVPGLSDVVGEGPGRVLVSNFHSSNAWVAAIRSMSARISNSSDALSEDVRQRSELFSLDKMKSDYIYLYHELIKFA